MSGQLESALVLSLVDSIKWESALGPLDETGVMTTVDPAAAIDVTKFARRDRELAYRDLINAAAVLKVSIEIETVFNSTPIRPKTQGLTTEVMPPTQGDLRQVNSQVVHVKNSSIPIDALGSDQDLAGRDALLYEVLSRACQVFSTPPLNPNDANGTLIPGITAWSQALGLENRNEVNPAWPMATNTFMLPDRNLADRDNQIAAYVSRLCQILKNPFEFADRLYVRVDTVNERELEVFALIRVYYEVGHVYLPDDEVYHGTSWWRAQQYTTSEPGTDSTDWTAITSPTDRIFQGDPSLLGRNRIVYNTTLKTLQWISESVNSVHAPQIFALSIPGPEIGQTITTVPTIPEAKDADFWRQKASRISYEGTLTSHIYGIHDTSQTRTGVNQADTTGLTGAGELEFIFTQKRLSIGHKYKFSALVKPSRDVTILGGYNSLGLTGTLSGLTFSGDYEPEPGVSEGLPVPFDITLPAGNWNLVLNYTDLEASTDGFGTKVRNNGVTILEDAAPLLFQNQNGIKYPVGTILQSNPIAFTAYGGINTFDIQWTYGAGQFHIRSLTLTTNDVSMGRYSMRLGVHTPAGVSVVDVSELTVPTVDAWGEPNAYSVMPFDFVTTGAVNNPHFVMTWMPEDNQLPLQVRQVQLEEVLAITPIPEFGGFLSWKQECLYRAMRAVTTAYAEYVSKTTSLPDFTTNGTLWDKESTENWMQAIETYQPRLRHIPDVSVIQDGRHYQVVNSWNHTGGYAVYNSGTYTAGMKFWGTSTSDSVFTYNSAQVDQQGAFTLSFPGHIGKPALLPLGLYYDGDYIKQLNPTQHQSPTVCVCMPWMIEAGIYVAHPDFWSPENVTTGLEIESPPLDRYPDTMPWTPGFREGSYDAVVFGDGGAVSVEAWFGSLSMTLVSTSGGTHAGTTSIEAWSGSLASVVVPTSGGTHAGTMGIEIWTGSIVTVVTATSGGTHAGTVGIEAWVGAFDTISVSGGGYVEYGTLSVGFLAGDYQPV